MGWTEGPVWQGYQQLSPSRRSLQISHTHASQSSPPPSPPAVANPSSSLPLGAAPALRHWGEKAGPRDETSRETSSAWDRPEKPFQAVPSVQRRSVVKLDIDIDLVQALSPTTRVQPEPSLGRNRPCNYGGSSNGGHIPNHGVNSTPGNSTFDVNQGLADTALRWDGPEMYKYLEDPECNDPTFHSPSQVFSNAVDGNEPYRTPECEGWVVGGTPDTNSVPMQLLNLGKQQTAALSEIYPAAKVEGNCITTSDYVVVLKLFLRDLMLSENRIEGVPHPKAYALLLSRLSGELGTCSFDADSMLDPADYAGCLAELLKDMEQTWKVHERDGELFKELKETWGPDACVYVCRATDNYAQCLLAAADALNSL